MAYNVIFTISSAGSNTGPFNISGTTNLGVTTLIQSGVSKAALEAGYELTISDDNITGGTVASTGTCTTSQPWTKPSEPAPTSVTLFYSFKQYPGANLIVTGSDSSELLNINSSAASAVNGNITIPVAKCPYKVKVSWISGSGNVVSYRLCDASGGEITYATGIDLNSVYNEYTVSPTPYTAYVNIASQSQTPNTCPS